MKLPSDSELQEMVRRVVARSLGEGTTPVASSAAPPAAPVPQTPPPAVEKTQVTVAIGADHGGFPLKQAVKEHLEGQGYTVIDCGTHSTDSVDYPDFARAVADLVGQGKVWRGIMIDGAGIGSCMAANKIPGVRASMCYDYATAKNAREHNDANLLTLGAGLIGKNLALQIVETWLATPFGGGRHARRVNKINELD
jgi:ribose 5-phosphate isomerase B